MKFARILKIIDDKSNGKGVEVRCPYCHGIHRHGYIKGSNPVRDAVCGRGMYTIIEKPPKSR